MKKAEAMKAASQPQPINQPQKIEGTGSVWNVNSYHWEEKSVAKWSEDTLKKILSSFTHTFNDTVLKITEISSLKGESSVSIRKAKKLILYEYQIKLKWELNLNDSEGNVVSKCEGTYELPEMSNEDDWQEWEVRVVYTKDEHDLRSAMDQMVRKFAPEALKK